MSLMLIIRLPVKWAGHDFVVNEVYEYHLKSLTKNWSGSYLELIGLNLCSSRYMALVISLNIIKRHASMHVFRVM